MYRSQKQWKHMVRCYTAGATDAQAEAIAERLVVKSWLQRSGADVFAAVWHEMALHCGTRCHCARCRAEAQARI